jgi:hypothetical protein
MQNREYMLVQLREARDSLNDLIASMEPESWDDVSLFYEMQHIISTGI